MKVNEQHKNIVIANKILYIIRITIIIGTLIVAIIIKYSIYFKKWEYWEHNFLTTFIWYFIILYLDDDDCIVARESWINKAIYVFRLKQLKFEIIYNIRVELSLNSEIIWKKLKRELAIILISQFIPISIVHN